MRCPDVAVADDRQPWIGLIVASTVYRLYFMIKVSNAALRTRSAATVPHIDVFKFPPFHP